MMRSLYSGVTGLRNHQTRMDVIGNNISNVNTVAFKGSRVLFQDIYSQTLSTASGPNGTNSGGTNARQVGLGMTLATIDTLNTPSSSQYTGSPLDVMIEGDGYFVISNGTQETYTRAGAFYTDRDNFLVNGNGSFVMGYNATTDPVTGAVTVDTSARVKIEIDPKYYDVSIDKNGMVIGIDRTTQQKVSIGQVVLATFSNPSGLEKCGSNSYRTTTNSGAAQYNAPGDAGVGTLEGGRLEMSNVDLVGEFTDMIVTQRGFQANSRIITTTDSMLEEIVNLKR